jgi:glyoxylase-like metal-dependent hydrolase (beta-lactamase superfamily II)
VISLGDGVWHFRSELWQTGTLLVAADGHRLVVDPALTPAEVGAVRAEATRDPGVSLHVLVTHSPFDHVAGVGLFPDAEVVAGEQTARLIRDGTAGRELVSAGQEWGIDWPSELHVDRSIGADAELEVGGVRVVAIEAPGNADDCLCYVLPDRGILLSADYLCPVTYPCPGGADTRATYDRLLAALDRYPVSWVAPGHGPPLPIEEARAVAAADVAYLDTVRRVAEDVVGRDLGPREAQLAVFSVEPPRANLLSLEIYETRNNITWRALREAWAERALGASRSEELWRRYLERSEGLFTSSGVLPER